MLGAPVRGELYHYRGGARGLLVGTTRQAHDLFCVTPGMAEVIQVAGPFAGFPATEHLGMQPGEFSTVFMELIEGADRRPGDLLARRGCDQKRPHLLPGCYWVRWQQPPP